MSASAPTPAPAPSRRPGPDAKGRAGAPGEGGVGPAPEMRSRIARRRAFLLALLHAVLFALSFHPAALFPLAWVCVAPLVLLLREAGRRQAVLWGATAYFLHGAFTVYWLTYMGAGPAPWLGTAAGFGLYGAVFGLLARPLAASRIPAAIWLPILWTGVECIRGKLFFFAFPWMWLGHSQYAIRPLVQVADLGGVLLVSFIVAAVNGAIADAWTAPRLDRRRVALRSGAFAGGLVLAACAYGAIRLATLEVKEGPRVLAVQPHFPQSVKNETDLDPRFRLEKCLDLTTEHGRGREVDLVVWPETIVPLAPVEDPGDRAAGYEYVALDRSRAIRSWLVEAARRARAPLFVGSGHIERRQGKEIEHNSAFYIAESGEVLGRYDKIYLAPVSEETPFHESWPALHDWIRATFVPPNFSQFERGTEAKVFPLGTWTFGGSICFDITFSAASNEATRRGADCVINVSNYAWFADSAELDLARAQSMFRAIETRRGVVSVVNGGITHFVDPLGRITDLEVGGRRKQVEGALLRAVGTSGAETLFVAIPTDAFAWACLGLSFLLAALGSRMRRPAGPRGA